MQRLHLPAVTHSFVASLARAVFLLQSGDRILDMGCGTGWYVVRLRELGYEAHGFDIAPFWQERLGHQQEWFRALAPKPPAKPYGPLEVPYKLPFADGFFDVVFSTQVLEHVRDLDGFFAEAARVLKPNGIMVNIYPSRRCLIETHTLIPFYPWFPCDALVRLAAKLGLRNHYQKGFTPETVIAVNRDFLRDGVFMYSAGQVNRAALRHFASVRDMAPAYYADRPRGLRLLWAYLQEALKDRELPLRGLAYFQRMEAPVFVKGE